MTLVNINLQDRNQKHQIFQKPKTTVIQNPSTTIIDCHNVYTYMKSKLQAAARNY